MRELPIHFNQDMVRALLEGRKSQTRRPIKNQDYIPVDYDSWGDEARAAVARQFARYTVGGLLYVRERVQYLGVDSTTNKHLFGYVADRKEIQLDRLPSRIKPIKFLNCVPNGCFKELARIWLKVTGIRVERVQDISPADCICEGIIETQVQVGRHFDLQPLYVAFPDKDGGFRSAVEAFECLWQSCYPESWERNDHVFVYDFERIEK